MTYQPDYVVLRHPVPQSEDDEDEEYSFQLREELKYMGKNGTLHRAKPPLTTDFSSVPHALWSIITPYGRQSLPAIMHDAECQALRKQGPLRTREKRRERRAIDSCFYEGLLEKGVPRYEATVVWSAVSVGRFCEHGSILQVLALFLQLALGYAAIVWGAFHFDDPLGWIAIAPALAALAWGRSSPAILFVQYPGMGFLLIGVVAYAVYLYNWGINFVFGARARKVKSTRPSPDLSKAKGRMWKGRRGKRIPHERSFRGVGRPRGLRILPRH